MTGQTGSCRPQKTVDRAVRGEGALEETVGERTKVYDGT